MTLQTAIPRPARLTIGRATDIVPLRRESDIEVANVAVRVADRPAFLAIIEAREAQLARPGTRKPSAMALAYDAAASANEAGEAIAAGDPARAQAELQTAAATILAALAAIIGGAA